jgi:hypothetical protein
MWGRLGAGGLDIRLLLAFTNIYSHDYFFFTQRVKFRQKIWPNMEGIRSALELYKSQLN